MDGNMFRERRGGEALGRPPVDLGRGRYDVSRRLDPGLGLRREGGRVDGRMRQVDFVARSGCGDPIIADRGGEGRESRRKEVDDRVVGHGGEHGLPVFVASDRIVASAPLLRRREGGYNAWGRQLPTGWEANRGRLHEEEERRRSVVYRGLPRVVVDGRSWAGMAIADRQAGKGGPLARGDCTTSEGVVMGRRRTGGSVGEYRPGREAVWAVGEVRMGEHDGMMRWGSASRDWRGLVDDRGLCRGAGVAGSCGRGE